MVLISLCRLLTRSFYCRLTLLRFENHRGRVVASCVAPKFLCSRHLTWLLQGVLATEDRVVVQTIVLCRPIFFNVVQRVREIVLEDWNAWFSRLVSIRTPTSSHALIENTGALGDLLGSRSVQFDCLLGGLSDPVCAQLVLRCVQSHLVLLLL